MTSKVGDRRYLAGLVFGALGVVYGDIGTSPLYALRECFYGSHAIPPTHSNVLGILSLIFWTLILIVSVKYITFVLRADNRGEGGILALLALASLSGPFSGISGAGAVAAICAFRERVFAREKVCLAPHIRSQRSALQA